MQNYAYLVEYTDGTSEVIGSDFLLDIKENCATLSNITIPLHNVRKLTKVK